MNVELRAKNKFFPRIIVLLVTEIFLVSSTLPAWALDTGRSHLRPAASDGSARSSLVSELRSDVSVKDGSHRLRLGWPTHLKPNPSQRELQDASLLYRAGQPRYSRTLQEILLRHARRLDGYTLLRIEPNQLKKARNKRREIFPRKFQMVAERHQKGDRFAPAVIGGLNKRGELFIIDGNTRAALAEKRGLPFYAYVGNSVLTQVKGVLGERPERKWWARRRRPHRAQASHSPKKEKEGDTPKARDGGEKKLTLYNGEDQRIIVAVDVPEGKGPHPVALMLHGYGESKNSPNVKVLSEKLVEKRYLTLRPDFRNHGPEQGNESDGRLKDFSIEEQIADVASVIQGMKAHSDIPADFSKGVILAGRSMGGITARRVAALAFQGDHRFTELRENLRAVIDLSGLIHPYGTVVVFLANGLRAKESTLSEDQLIERAERLIRLWGRKRAAYVSHRVFGQQRYWLRGWEDYRAVKDLEAIPAEIPYIYVVGQDPVVLNGGLKADYRIAQYEGLAVSQHTADFLEALATRGIPPKVWHSVEHDYKGKALPEDVVARIPDPNPDSTRDGGKRNRPIQTIDDVFEWMGAFFRENYGTFGYEAFEMTVTPKVMELFSQEPQKAYEALEILLEVGLDVKRTKIDFYFEQVVPPALDHAKKDPKNLLKPILLQMAGKLIAGGTALDGGVRGILLPEVQRMTIPGPSPALLSP